MVAERSHSTFSIILSIFAVCLNAAPSTNSTDATFRNSLETFSQNLFSEIANSLPNENVIYSPFSIQTLLAMVRIGADGTTATEMDHGLGFTGQTPESVADSYHSLLSKFENSNLVTLADRIYVKSGSELQDNYKNILNEKFYTSIESINFSQSDEAANTINNWVETKTNQLIKNLVAPEVIDASTRCVLLNAIHFKGYWSNAFDKEATRNVAFYINETNTINVPTMHVLGGFETAYYEDLDATAVRLPYNNSDLSMLIFLPDSRTGLAAMQEKLMHKKLESLTQRLQYDELIVGLPKFKAEFSIELTGTLKNLGMRRMFETADFGKMLKSSGDLSISNVFHKAVIEVNEQGTDAAAATEFAVTEFSEPPMFVADHPFYYVVLNADNVVLFQGNVVTFES